MNRTGINAKPINGDFNSVVRKNALALHEIITSAILELDLDKCENVYGFKPCEAGKVLEGDVVSATSTTIVIGSEGSMFDDVYIEMRLHINSGTGAGQDVAIDSYTASSKTITITGTFDVTPDATSTYSLHEILSPDACYNTFTTCQDKANYIKGTKTYKFIMEGSTIPPGELHRPYISRVKGAVTEITLDRGLSRRSKIQVTLRDELDNDTEQDPYLNQRIV